MCDEYLEEKKSYDDMQWKSIHSKRNHVSAKIERGSTFRITDKDEILNEHMSFSQIFLLEICFLFIENCESD